MNCSLILNLGPDLYRHCNIKLFRHHEINTSRIWTLQSQEMLKFVAFSFQTFISMTNCLGIIGQCVQCDWCTCIFNFLFKGATNLMPSVEEILYYSNLIKLRKTSFFPFLKCVVIFLVDSVYKIFLNLISFVNDFKSMTVQIFSALIKNNIKV